MSLFSRLEERMRARDNQDEPKEKAGEQPASAEGGLFGAVQLEPPRAESSVPPRAETGVPQREVPSIEEARAEFDRARASFAANQSESDAGATLRETPIAESSRDEAQPKQSPDVETRDVETPTEAVSFGAVTLPLLTPQSEPAPRTDAPEESSAPPQTSTVFASKSLFAPTQIEADSNVLAPQTPVAVPDLDATVASADTSGVPAPRATKRERSRSALGNANHRGNGFGQRR